MKFSAVFWHFYFDYCIIFWLLNQDCEQTNFGWSYAQILTLFYIYVTAQDKAERNSAL